MDEGEDTRHRLLRAGRRLFGELGYDGASVRAITRGADANLGAITYHFGSKEGLYHSVLEECIGPVREPVAAAAARSESPLEGIEGVVRAYMAHLAENPDLPRFMAREVALGHSPSPPVLLWMRHILDTLAELIREGQKRGQIRPLDPLLGAISILAQPILLTVVGRALAGVAPLEERSSQSGRFEDHAAEFVRRGLAVAKEADDVA